MNTVISRKDFEAWVELLDAKIVVKPDYRSSMIRVQGLTPIGTKFEFEVSGLALTPEGAFYARGAEGWDAVKVTGKAHFFGKGARDAKSWKWMEEMVDFLQA